MIEISRSKRTLLGYNPQGKRRWALNASLQALQYRENGGPWQDIDPAIEDPDTGGFTIKTGKTPYLGRIGDDSHRRIYPDRTDLSYWIQFEKPFASMPAPTRLNRWFYWDFTNSIIGVRFENAQVKFGFRLKNAAAPTSITIPFSTAGLTRTGNILYHSGQPVAVLSKPFALDANGVERDCTVVFGAGNITISLDTTGLTFPIDIDPTVDVDVDASTDDADQTFGGAMNLTRYYTILKSGGAPVSRYYTGWRFTSGSFPVTGDTIDACHISIFILNNTYDDIEADMYFEKSGASPGTFTAAGSDISSRTKTTTKVDWNDTGMAGGWEDSPSLVTPLQELIDAYSPTAIVLLGYPGSVFDREMRCYAYDPPSSYPPALYIEWTESGGGGGDKTDMSAKMVAAGLI